jgi:hypothetical protein
MKRPIYAIACGLTLATLTAEVAIAAPDFAGCPPLLETTQKLVGDYPGWTATDTTNMHVFGGIGVSEHNPDQKGDLKPGQIELGNNRTYNYWEIGGPDYWLTCGYADAPVYLGKLIPKGKTICLEEISGGIAISAACR